MKQRIAILPSRTALAFSIPIWLRRDVPEQTISQVDERKISKKAKLFSEQTKSRARMRQTSVFVIIECVLEEREIKKTWPIRRCKVPHPITIGQKHICCLQVYQLQTNSGSFVSAPKPLPSTYLPRSVACFDDYYCQELVVRYSLLNGSAKTHLTSTKLSTFYQMLIQISVVMIHIFF